MVEYLKLIIDFGLLVMVWVVQLCVYPSFKYFSIENLKKWHPIYSRGITWIAGPLMLAQLLSAIFIVNISASTFSIMNLVLVTITWLITFLWALPLHRALDQKDEVEETLMKLMWMNRIRAWIWTLIFLWTLGIMTL